MSDDWIEHDGNGIPVAHRVKVDIQVENGMIVRDEEAVKWGGLGDKYCWWSGSSLVPGYNITHYRLSDARD